MRVRQLILLATSVFVAVILVVALLTPVDRAGERQAGQTPQPTATPSTSPAESGGTEADRDEIEGEEVDGLRVISAQGEDQRVRLRPDEALRLRVTSDEAVAVQVGLTGPVEYAGSGAPAEFALFGREGFDEPVRLLESGREIGRVFTAQPR